MGQLWISVTRATSRGHVKKLPIFIVIVSWNKNQSSLIDYMMSNYYAEVYYGIPYYGILFHKMSKFLK